MPSVTFNGQSFAIDNRRFWIMGASIQYARVPANQWARRIAAARQAGFNTIETACPWSMHEPRRDQFELSGQCDVREFISLCGKAGMKVILRPGPYIGSGFDGGGLPAWLTHQLDIAVREGNEAFLERVNVYFRKLLGELADLQVTRGGPILLVQSEHAWLCSNREQADAYLREVTRVIRESGFAVPIINANDFWQDSQGTIDTWRGSEDLLGHMRQLRTVQHDAPRLLSAFKAAPATIWGEQQSAPSADELVCNLAQCLAAGAQAVVTPFHGGTNFGFSGGRKSGASDRFIATSAATGAMLGEAGWRGERYNAMKRITMFASNFGSLFADLETDYHPVVLDVPCQQNGTGRGRKAGSASVVSLRGSQGQVIFVFADAPGARANLLLENGVRMPVNLGAQRVAWFVLDADINGSGRIDYANLMPFGITGRSIVVFYGPKGADAYISINSTPFQGKVPSGSKPVVVEHKGAVIVLCNEQQIDTTYLGPDEVYVGVAGLEEGPEGVLPIPLPGATQAWKVTPEAELIKLTKDDMAAAPPSRRRTIALNEWEASSAEAYASGQSPRFASLGGPETLTDCGAQTGYGWYSMRVRSSNARKRVCHLPQAADRVQLWLDGEALGVVGDGPGASAVPFELKMSRGDHVLTALVDNMGRFHDGNELTEYKGLFGHVYEVKAMRTVKPQQEPGDAIDPFIFRGYIAKRSKGQLSETTHVCWSFTHAKKSPIIIDIRDVNVTGTLLLNDEPLAYYTGATGPGRMQLVIGRDLNESFKRGKNVLRFAPDAHQENALEEISKGLTLYEVAETITEGVYWAFAKWEPPQDETFQQVSKTGAKALRRAPCWWRCTFATPGGAQPSLPLWFDTQGLSKGQLFLNGHNVGRYFTATGTGKAVGPQTRLYLPDQWLSEDGPNELLLFDEHGFDPYKTRLVLDAVGDLDR